MDFVNRNCDCVSVIVRIRPRKKSEKLKTAKTIVKLLDSKTILFDPKSPNEDENEDRIHFTKKRGSRNISFVFDSVFGPKSTNVEVFESSFRSISDQILKGYSCSVFAYGATGSGKTFTMLGNQKQPGLIFLLSMELYKAIEEVRNEYETDLTVSYFEVYNETLKDLLQESNNLLNIREDRIRGIYIPNLTKHKPKDTDEMLRLLHRGNSRRSQHPTDQNAESSRSHAIFQISVCLRQKFTTKTRKYKTRLSKLTMVDLAGSERRTAHSNAGEGSNINKSLLALGNCINALADGKKHVPYRDSKLTRILKDSLGGKNRTIMITNLSPTHLNYEDTFNSLNYAQRAKDIKTKCVANVVTTIDKRSIDECEHKMRDLELQIEKLKHAVNQQKRGQMPNSHSTLLTQNAKAEHLESFIQLISQQKTAEESFVSATIQLKENEWSQTWIKWKIAVAEALDGNSTTNIHQLTHELQEFQTESTEIENAVQIARQLVNFNEEKLQNIHKTSLRNLKGEDPFLTVNLSEFLHYKYLEREMSKVKMSDSFHRQINTLLIDEIVESEEFLVSAVNALKLILDCVLRNDSISQDDKMKCEKIVKNVNEFKRFCGSAKHDLRYLAEELIEFLQNPLVEFQQKEEESARTTAMDSTGNSMQPSGNVSPVLSFVSDTAVELDVDSSGAEGDTSSLEDEIQKLRNVHTITTTNHEGVKRRTKMEELANEKPAGQMTDSVSSVKTLYERRKRMLIKLSQSKSAFGRSRKPTKGKKKKEKKRNLELNCIGVAVKLAKDESPLTDKITRESSSADAIKEIRPITKYKRKCHK